MEKIASHQWKDKTLILHIKLQPKASRNEITGIKADRISIRITTDNKANDHLRRFLAGEFGVSVSAVSLVRGEKSRQITLQIVQPKKIPAWLSHYDVSNI